MVVRLSTVLRAKRETDFVMIRSILSGYLLLRKMQGVWYIIDAFAAEEAVAHAPVYIWQRIRRGAEYVLARLLTGWRRLTQRAVAGT